MTQLTRPGTPTLPLDRAELAHGLAARLRDYATLTKPRITTLVVITALVGFIASGASGGLLLMTAMAVGTALSCMGAAALNQAYERHTDGMMQRTRNRPLPAGRMSLAEALALGLGLSAAGVAALALLTTPLAAAASAFTIVTYAAVYTPLKRVTSFATLLGAVPGAMPPVIGYAAATGTLGAPAWMLFALMLIWQIPHFLAIAWLYRDDYARAGLPMLAVTDPTGRHLFAQVVAACIILLGVGLWPTLAGLSGWVYGGTALACGLIYLALGLALQQRPSRTTARRLFLASLLYLPLVLAVLLLDLR